MLACADFTAAAVEGDEEDAFLLAAYNTVSQVSFVSVTAGGDGDQRRSDYLYPSHRSCEVSRSLLSSKTLHGEFCLHLARKTWP